MTVAGGARGAERTFSFVDLAGFTALTEAHGDTDAVGVLDRFEALVRAALSAGGELVKTMGDAAMLASPDPAAAIQTLERLWESCGEACGFPLPRAGAHHGRAVARAGDYLGASVNLAARVADQAGGGQVLATAGVAEAARLRGREVVGLGAHRLRNLPEPVELFEIRLGLAGQDRVVDPVCRMRVEADRAVGTLLHAGRRHWFCSVACLTAFATDPGCYLASEA